jgi:hypothetical protein
MFYMTPKYRNSIITKVINELNRVYSLFIQRFPNFERDGGKVSILGHSLGSVISFDILSFDKVSDTNNDSPRFSDDPGIDLVDKLFEQLKFKVDTFYAMGSPIGLFLLLRNKKLGVKDIPGPYSADECTKCLTVRRFYNIFHPHDPVAYRLEPFVSKRFLSSQPFDVPYHKGGIRGLQNGFVSLSTDVRTKTTQQFKNLLAKLPPLGTDKRSDITLRNFEMEDDTSKKSNEERILKCLNPNGRIDYVLQEGALSNQYLSSLTSHINYWSDVDTANFIASTLESM